MSLEILSENDLKFFNASGISDVSLQRQLEGLRQGFHALDLDRPATVGDGIRVIGDDDAEYLLRLYRKAQEAGRFSKFVPASGAASRMFELLIEFDRRQGSLGVSDLIQESQRGNAKSQNFLGFLKRVKRLAFYDDLKRVAGRDYPDDISQWSHDDVRGFLRAILGKTGLNYAQCPKGLIKFHRYPDGSRTALEEHLHEGIEYLMDGNNIVRVHFTVPPDYELQIRQYLNSFQSHFHARRIVFDITYSYQKSSTHTVSFDAEGHLLRDKGVPVLRPGGHGALLENLQALKGDLIFIRNIDNIAVESMHEDVIYQQKILGGYLIRLQDRAFAFLSRLSSGELPAHFWSELEDFCRHELCLVFDENILKETEDARRAYFIRLLNRPIRVCGMVKNQGEPGGGPFWVRDSQKRVSLQIVESSQVDRSIPDQADIFTRSTHFNPVNLVCGLKDFQGQSFTLDDFVDHGAGFVSSKTKDGQAIRIFEWPGLWNGAMARWITVFVEVPVEIFTPVKTVLDLLRPEHQASS